MTPAQTAFQNLRLGMFLTYGINTYYDLEWSDGTLSPTRYNPTQLDTDQWCRTAQAAGMTFVLFVTKHIDGFCNWPTHTTDYSTRNTPFQGDVLDSLANSCRKYNLKLGLYYALWDFRHDRGQAAYPDFVIAQLTELLTRYGDVVELWFDGAWTKFELGYRKGAPVLTEMWQFPGNAHDLQHAWRAQCAPLWRWDDLYAHVKSLQPNTIVLNNTTTDFPGVPLFPVDARTGEKATADTPDQPVWNDGTRDVTLPLQIETTLSQKGPPGPFENGSWFHHPWDHSIAPKSKIQSWIQQAQSKNAVLVLNCGITPEGKLRKEDEQALLGLNSPSAIQP